MTEISSHILNPKLVAAEIELNNNISSQENNLNVIENDSFPRQRSISRVSVSSVSSSNSDTSEDGEIVGTFGDENTKTENILIESQTPTNKEFDIRKIFHSLSDDQAEKINKDLTEIFPSLPTSFLINLGLYGEVPRERLKEEEIEQKFIALALAFTIDAATIKDRCSRQRRYRDQTETNLISEIDRLIDKVTRIQPLYVDAETAELLAGLLTQIDVVIRASSHAAISAERFGAVQHEERLAEAVSLMINHVSLLKQQRDSTRKQLQYTKRVLQDTNAMDSLNSKQRLNANENGRTIAKRRASIATPSHPQDCLKNPTGGNNLDIRRITRRTSDSTTTRISAFARSSRPSRLELGVDLDKIKEGIAENPSVGPHQELMGNNEVEEIDENGQQNNLPLIIPNINVDYSILPLRQRIIQKYKQFTTSMYGKYATYSDNGNLHEFFYISALLCFVLGFVVLGNLLIEIQKHRFALNQENKELWCTNECYSNFEELQTKPQL